MALGRKFVWPARLTVIYRMFDSLRLDTRLLVTSSVFQKAWNCGWCDVIFKSMLSSRQCQVSNEPHHLVWPPDWATGVWLMKLVRTINEGLLKCATSTTPMISLKITETFFWPVFSSLQLLIAILFFPHFKNMTDAVWGHAFTSYLFLKNSSWDGRKNKNLFPTFSLVEFVSS